MQLSSQRNLSTLGRFLVASLVSAPTQKADPHYVSLYKRANSTFDEKKPHQISAPPRCC